MNRSIDVQSLQRAVVKALRERPRGVAGGWSASKGKGTVYTGATFDFGAETWVVVRGPQRPVSAQLLDATAWLMHAEGAAHAVALLDPETKEPRHAPALSPFRERYQAAVWHGLSIVSLETEGPGAWTWEPAEAPACGDIDALGKKVEAEIEARRLVGKEWGKVVESDDSPGAEPLVRAAVGAALGKHFEESDPKLRAFDALWRHAVADGLWSRKGGAPASVALEVKVTEDVGAPFCQAFDDLGAFDSVLYVRLVSKKTRKDIERLTGLGTLKTQVMKKVPVRFIEVHF